MFARSLAFGFTVLAISVAHPARAGYYSTIDAPEETRYSRDFLTFAKVMDTLGAIGSPRPATDPPIRRRYILIEALARDGTLKLDTLAQQLDYSAVLIRRGRAFEAARFLGPVSEDSRDNFLVLSQYAAANFLSGNRGLEIQSARFMKRALEKWPTSWTDVKEEQKRFLEAFGFNEYEFARQRRCEEYFELLLLNRLKEKELQDQQKKSEETVDPIFPGKDKKPIRFMNDKGEYEAGRIAAADKAEIPRDAVEVVEQLLIWLPGDERLLWLLAETLNASAMEHQNQRDKNAAVHNANKIFQRLTSFKTPTNYGLKEVTLRAAVSQAYADANPIDIIAPPPEDPNDVRMTSQKWWQTLAVVMAVGVAVGMFALWQVQEMRRRRQARASRG